MDSYNSDLIRSTVTYQPCASTMQFKLAASLCIEVVLLCAITLSSAQLNAPSTELKGCVLISFQIDKNISDDQLDLNELLHSLSQVVYLIDK